jgi:hypothetical protein
MMEKTLNVCDFYNLDLIDVSLWKLTQRVGFGSVRFGSVRLDWVGLGLIMMEKTLNVYDFYNLDLKDVSL